MKNVLVLLSVVVALTACKENKQTVVIAGDSWAAFVCANKSMDTALSDAGMKDVSVHPTCATTVENGVKVNKWFQSHAYITSLAAIKDPSVKVLYLSLGGNDLMNYWKKTMTSAEEQEVYSTARQHLADVVNAYRQVRPDIRILVSGYDYPRFTENHPIEAYKKAYEEMGSPTPLEVNRSLQKFSEEMAKVADGQNVFYIHHLGLSQYYKGNSEAGLEPFTTLPPELISSPQDPNRIGGDINLQSDATAMLRITELELVDAFHLNKAGFNKVAAHAVDLYIKKWLAPAE